MQPTVSRICAAIAAAGLAAGAVLLAAGGVLLILAGAVLPGTAPALAAPAMPRAAAPGATTGPWAGPRGVAGGPAARHVVLIGVPGLLWSDVTAARMPDLWRLAGQGSAGSLSVTGVHPLTCPADGWLTLNAGNRAALPRPPGGACQRLPAITVTPGALAGDRAVPSAARVTRMPSIVSANVSFSENPSWGLLRSAAGPGRCAIAAGPGAALALASPAGRVSSYLAGTSLLNRAVLARCPLTVIGMGALPVHAAATRMAALAADDHEIGRVGAALPPGATLVVAGTADGAVPHLHPIVITGPGFQPGLLTSPSTRQPGLVLLTDLTPTIAGWLGQPVPGTAVGARLSRTGRASLAAATAALAGQDTAAQVYRTTMPWFFVALGLGGALLFGLIAVLGAGPWRRRRGTPRALARGTGVALASVPAGSFLASLVPWWAWPHPALLLYGLTVAWAAVIAAAACGGPWRRDPLGPPGFVGAVTLGVLAIDVMTGSHLQLGTPFGLSALVAGRFYGIGNNAVLVYAASGLLLCGWIGSAALRRGSRRLAVTGMSAVAVVAVAAAGWPGFGDKVGGTIAMVPGFLLLIAAAGGARITARRGLLIVASGAAVAAALAVTAYLLPGHSDISAFVGRVLHGGAAAIVHRKIRANVSSLTATAGNLVMPVVVAVSGAVIGWPARFRAGRLARGFQQLPLLRPLLAVIWLVGLLGWLADDSGVTVPAAGLPLILPLVVAILAAVRPVASPPGGMPPGPGGQTAGHVSSGSGEPGYL